MNDIHFKYITPEMRRELDEAGADLSRVLKVAIQAAQSMPSDPHLVSGPITTGGVGNPEGNMLVFGRAIEHMAADGVNIFSQVPYHENMVKFHKEWTKTAKAGDYCWPILLNFYEPLFAAVKFKAFHFIHGYESSTGARWEHDQCDKRGFEKYYLPKEFSFALLAQSPLAKTN